MQKTAYLSSLATFLALSLASSAQASRALALHQSNFKSLTSDFHIQAKQGSVKALSPFANTLQFINEHQDKHQVKHMRLQQRYEGFDVFGGYALLHSQHTLSSLVAHPLKASDLNMTGRVYLNLSTELGAVPDYFLGNAKLALATFKSRYPEPLISQAQVKPLIYIDAQNKAHWAYQMSLLLNYADKMPEKPTAIVDASTYQSLIEWNDIKTKRRAAKGTGFGGNEKIGSFNYGKDLPFLDISRDDKRKMCYMENPDVRIIDMQHKYDPEPRYQVPLTKRTMQFDCKQESRNVIESFWTGHKSDGYDKYNGAYSPSNDALYAGYVIKHMYHDWYQVEALSKPDGSAMQLIMRVHYGQGYENAYWDGEQMTYGDGEDMMYPLVSLGIGAHEVSHGFTQQHANLVYQGQSGGLNESFSDMAAQTAEFYANGSVSWTIGAEIVKKDSGLEALRYMDIPSKDGQSIDSAKDYYEGIDVHHSSGVFNRLFYLMASLNGWDVRKAFEVMLKANMDYWTPYSNFNEAGCDVLYAAKDLNFNSEELKPALMTVGLDLKTCE